VISIVGVVRSKIGCKYIVFLYEFYFWAAVKRPLDIFQGMGRQPDEVGVD
jgi:hypothetical protein